jgi:prophage antirepressor-like protein
MNPLAQAFQYSGKPLRVAGTPDKPLFVAADVCAHLGLGNVAQAVNGNPNAGAKGLPSSEIRDDILILDTTGRRQKLLCVTESGLYRLIFKSQKKEAEAFQTWVFDEVLPAIRKTGYYEMAQRSIVLERFLLEAPGTWQKEFGDDYFAAVMRLYGHRFSRKSGTPGFVGTFTKTYVYEPLLAGLTDELKARRAACADANPDTFSGLEKLHQFIRSERKELLRRHVIVVTTLAQNAHSIEEFQESFSRVFNNEDQLPLRLLGDMRRAAA